ncbi:efflux RND transporter permease subunit [Fundidesulfovibrio soli]|uniref:efflux RND transporter permease subunit n=1 Tax=Fundidesulfovibrio soli TaxID=2922716 RepID=UPI001FAEB5D7|nr:multidrug efflux RND transporter permease subunit [Fundidesulfovibrio soli]
MAKFFINRPIVAIVISVFIVIIGTVAILGLPIAQYPNIVPPEIFINTTYVGADSQTVEQSVATPIEQEMSGVDNMNYMYSLNANNGELKLYVNFDVSTDPNIDQVLAQMRKSQSDSKLPSDVRDYGVTVKKSTSSPLMLVSLVSPNETHDATFLANYAYINLNDQLTRVPGIASVTVFGAGQYAMRLWVRPDILAKLGITVPEIVNAVKKQNTVNPAGQIGAEPAPPGQEYTYAIRAQGRLETPDEFADIVVRANPDGSIVRLSDVARIELDSQTYSMTGRLNGKPSAVLALYQLPGSNAIAAVDGVKKLMEEVKRTSFPQDLDYVVSLDTTQSVREGIKEILHTLGEALVLVIIVVFIFLQGWRATLIPALAVPVSLIGTFAFFPVIGFSINTIALMGLVLAIGLVVDDAIVVVEAVEHHLEHGLSPKEATLKAMEEVSGPVVAIALVLSAVFLPTIFIPGITGRLYQQFAITIAISVLISAFTALTLSPALSVLILRKKKEARGPLGAFYRGFNNLFGKATNGYVNLCGWFIRKALISIALLVAMTLGTGMLAKIVPGGFLPEEDQGYFYAGVQLPDAASLQRTSLACKDIESIIMSSPGVEFCTTVAGYSMLSGITNTYSGFFFVTLKPWHERKKPEEQYTAIMANLNQRLRQLPQGTAFAFSPPAIPGIGTSGGVTFILEDRAGKDIPFLWENVQKFLAEAAKRPEIGRISTTFLPTVPQVFVDVDRDKVLKQGVDLAQVYSTLQAFMGGYFINYFNRFGRQWQVYLQAEGEFRTEADQLGQFYVRNAAGQPVPLSTLTRIENRMGPEFTMRYNLYRSAQINATPKPGYSSTQAMKALEEVFRQTMPREMGYDYMGMSYQEKKAQEGVPVSVVFALSLLFVFLILAAQYESWSLPFSVLLGTPVAIFGAFAGIFVRSLEFNIYAEIGLIMLIGLAAKNAILIVEFAKVEYEKGKGLVEAALEGAKLRLRPILMTSFAFILGCVPLALATGSGAVSRKVMGTGVIGGMLAATVIAIFLIPVTFYLVEKMSHKGKHDAANVPPDDASGATHEDKENKHA